ncbi:D-alanyl-D-alanine carboxypeptidase family protein [Rhizobium alvei]|uniref:D-alanyl-D-alanine carboxypeptidase family protein n=1 Tax=Rhizobium alvei TaxID=1132659 RepID=A0ABT8YUP4_9HYPH|nr:D-alanyl-D-alanine carboxypeptidase family protein [Rhizobium alvei]MDO6967052.1 D-alanyl-D-alanine carboxypeptidase family protein [Rhizobium alvei]
MKAWFERAMRGTVCISTALAMCGASLLPAAAGPHLLVDVQTGKVIEHEDAFQRWYPASLTKLMTAYTVFRQIDAGRLSLSTPIIMSKKSAAQPASKMYLKPGDSMTLDDALKVLLVKSANDVAYAIAENVSGSMPDFVNLMNAEAARLGMTSTHFINPNGLPGKGQYTTAHDLGILAVTLKRNYPQYAHYFSLEGIKVGKREYGNYNKLIGRFPGADGMKTGFICASGFNQVSSATRGGRTVVSVVLGSDSLIARADLSAALLEKGLSTRTGFSMPAIERLPAYGATRDVVSDISEDICKKKGKKVRSEGQDDAHDPKVVSPFSKPIDRPLNVALITIIPAGKAMADAKLSNDEGEVAHGIPIPEPRPLN